MSHNLFWLLYLIPLHPGITLIYAFTVKVNCATQQIAFFLHRDEINMKTKMSTNELNPCGIPGIFPLRMLRLSSYFFWSYFPVFGIIFIFRTFVFWGSIPYGKIIPLYLNRVVRLTPVIIAKIDSWTLGKSPRMQSWPTSACLKSCFAKWGLGNAATI